MDSSASVEVSDDFASTWVAWSAVAILSILYLVAQLDRQLISLLITPIKRDLGATDFQLSLLQGTAFAVFYALCSLPIGWAVDRVSRRWIAFFGVFIWSCAATSCGLARNVWQLFFARTAVGAGEAGLTPTTYSMLADLFPPGRLAFALAIFAMSGTFGTAVAFMLGGPVVQWLTARGALAIPIIGLMQPWQMAFVLAGLPGAVLAFIIFSIPEPRRRHQPSATSELGFAEALRFMRRRPRFFICHNLGFGLVQAAILALQMWNPTYFARVHGWPPAQIGLSLGVAQLTASVLGLMIHSSIVDRLFRNGLKNAHLLWFVWMCLLAIPTAVGAYLVSNGVVTIVLYGVFYFLLISCPSIGPAALQIVTPGHFRGKVSSLYMLSIGLIGAAGGPSIVAAITDFVFHDESKIGWSMAIAAVMTLSCAALLFSMALRPMREAVDDIQAGSAGSLDRATT